MNTILTALILTPFILIAVAFVVKAVRETLQ